MVLSPCTEYLKEPNFRTFSGFGTFPWSERRESWVGTRTLRALFAKPVARKSVTYSEILHVCATKGWNYIIIYSRALLTLGIVGKLSF